MSHDNKPNAAGWGCGISVWCTARTIHLSCPYLLSLPWVVTAKQLNCLTVLTKAMSLQITRAHSFPRQILPNSADHFAKFCGSLRQNCSNSAADHGHPFVSKLSFVLSKNLKAGIVVSYASNIQRKLSIFSFFKVQSVKSNCVYLWLCAILWWLLLEFTVLSSSVWTLILYSLI